MRLTCSQKSLAHALTVTNKAVNPNSTLPVLNNVLLKAEGKKLSFSGTNLEIAIDHWIEATVKNEGQITVPSRLLTNYINYLKDENVDLMVEEGGVIVVKSSDSTTKIKGIPASEFPPIPTVEKESEVVVSVEEFKRAVAQVVFAASLNTTRPVLAGVYFYSDKKSLKLVATDSYRLAEKTLTPQKINGEVNCIIPAKTLMEVAAVLESGKKDDVLTIVFSKNQVLFSFDKTQVVSRLIDGQFPNYQQIIPKDNAVKATFNLSELSLALKRINLFAKENNNKVILKIVADGVVITTDTTQYGEGETHLKLKSEGVGEIALNSQYILDIVGSLDGGEALFQFGEKTSPVLIQSTKKDDYVHIIMPLKL